MTPPRVLPIASQVLRAASCSVLLGLLPHAVLHGDVSAQQRDWRVVGDAVGFASLGSIVYDVARARTVGYSFTEVWELGGSRWTRAESRTRPSLQFNPVLVYDAVRRVTVAFGGAGQSVETWEWDGEDWLQRKPAVSPSIRRGHAMAYDVHRKRTILFGGDNGLRDTWEWNGTRWLERRLATKPPALALHAMVYDVARRRVVLFGGVDNSVEIGQTWEYDGQTWNRVQPATSPSPRRGPSMSYDAKRGVTVLFGGYDGVNFLRDTWEWDGQTWTQRTPATSPPVHRGPGSLAYDVVRERTILVNVKATWHWDGKDWSRLETPAHPGYRAQHAIAHDSVRGQSLLFGGRSAIANRSYDDTWQFDGLRWKQSAISVAPSPRYGHSMAFETGRNTTVLFGGLANGGGALADTWEWNGARWRKLNPTVSPPARGTSAMAYDARRGEIVLFGGRATGALDDTWVFDGTTWSRKNPSKRPPARMAHNLVYDAARQRCVLFGGIAVGPVAFDDVWEWDGTTWTANTSPSQPAGNGHSPIVCEPRTGRLHFFGNVGIGLSRTWEFGSVGHSRTEEYGKGCLGSHGVPKIRSRGLPRIGDALVGIEASSLPPRAPVLLMTSSQGANLPLSGGCSLLVSLPPIVSLGVADADGAVFFSRPVPNDVRLRGGQVFDQIVVGEAGIGAWRNLLTFSPGLKSVID